MSEHAWTGEDGSRGLPPRAPERGTAVSLAGRAAAAAAGAVTLIACATFTLGTVLVAPLGVLAARALAKRRGGSLSRGAAWVGAVAICFLAVPAVFGLLLARAPSGTVDTIRAAMDSAQTRQKPAQLPEWLERVTPPGTQQRSAATHKLFSSGPFVGIFAILSIFAVCSMLGTIAGSIGWVASMLLAYAITGRWIPSGDPPPVAPLGDD